MWKTMQKTMMMMTTTVYASYSFDSFEGHHTHWQMLRSNPVSPVRCSWPSCWTSRAWSTRIWTFDPSSAAYRTWASTVCAHCPVRCYRAVVDRVVHGNSRDRFEWGRTIAFSSPSSCTWMNSIFDWLSEASWTCSPAWVRNSWWKRWQMDPYAWWTSGWLCEEIIRFWVFVVFVCHPVKIRLTVFWRRRCELRSRRDYPEQANRAREMVLINESW